MYTLQVSAKLSVDAFGVCRIPTLSSPVGIVYSSIAHARSGGRGRSRCGVRDGISRTHHMMCRTIVDSFSRKSYIL